MEVVGKIKVIDSIKEVGSAGFKKRDVVVTTDEQYPQDIQIQFVQDKCDLLDKFKVGQEVKIGINLRGREWTNAKGEVVYFNTIQGWKIDKSYELQESKSLAEIHSESVHKFAKEVSVEAEDLPF